MKKRIFSSIISVFLVLAMVSSVILPEAVNPLTGSAASSVYDFDYGPGITWPQDQDFPTFSPITANEQNPMDAIYVSSMPAGAQYAMYTLQGLVNRESPRLIVQTNVEEGKDTWPSKLVGSLKVRISTDYKAMINKYKSVVNGLIVYDESKDYTMNVATSIAGVESCIVVSPSIAAEVRSATGLQIKFDFRNYNFDSKESAYNWLYDNYYATGKLTKRLLMGLSPTDHLKNRDMAVALKAAVLWLQPNVASEKAVLDKFYSQATPGVTYHLGWWPSEDEGVIYATKNGVSTVPSDHFENMTVYAATSRKLDVPTVPAKPKLQNKIYVALAFSDGDNVQYNEHVMYLRWKDSTRSKVPISWTVSPALYYLAPQMLNYYYQTAGDNSMFVSGPSGLGYTKTTRWSDKEGFLEKYVKATDSASEKTGINIITLWDRISESNFSKFANKTKTTIALTINNNAFNDRDPSDPNYMYTGGGYQYYPFNGNIVYSNNIPLLGLGSGMGYETSTDSIYNNLKALAEKFDGKAPVFRLAQAVPWNVTTSSLYSLYSKLNKEYPNTFEFVRADHLFMLANEFNKKPYNLALRAATQASYTDEGSNSENGVDGSFTTGWSASNGSNKWYQVDLGKICTINRYVLKNAETGYYDASENTKAYRFEYSYDGVDWKIAESVSNNTEDILYRRFSNPITARYVRISFIDPGAKGVARIQDLEIYGNAIDVSKDLLQQTVNSLGSYTKSQMTDYMWNKLQSAISEANTAISGSKENEYQAIYSKLIGIKNSIDNGYDIPATAISISSTSVNMKVGEIYEINPVLVPSTTSDRITEWTTSNSKVATVSGGIVKAVGIGTATITMKTNRGLTKTVEVAVKVPVTSISLNKSSYTLKKGEGFYLTASVLPLNATITNVVWSSSNKAVATVNEQGYVLAKGAGTAEIKATSADNSSIYKTCKITVLPPVSKVSVSKSTVSIPQGKSVKLTVTVTPKNAYNKTLTFKTSNKNVAKVKSGKIYGVNGGTAKITISAGGKKATVKVYVDGLSKDKKALYKSGKKLKNKWLKVNGKWYYANSKGVVVKGKMIGIKGKIYSFNKNGVCKNKK